MSVDGTVPQWIGGYGDCFGPDASFGDVMQHASGRLTAVSVPTEVAIYLARAAACRAVPRPPPRERYMEVPAIRECGDRGADLKILLERYGSDTAVRARLRPHATP